MAKISHSQHTPTPPSRVPGTLGNATQVADARTVDYYFSVLDKVGREDRAAKNALKNMVARPGVAAAPTIDIEQEAAREQKIRNDNAEQDIQLKRLTLNRLFVFLLAETAVIFLFAVFQGAHWPHKFHLEDWSFKLLVTATIAQITGMLFVAVRYLFPSSK